MATKGACRRHTRNADSERRAGFALVRRRTSAKPARLSESALRVCRRHAPLVAIGVGRLLAVKAADYHEVATP